MKPLAKIIILLIIGALFFTVTKYSSGIDEVVSLFNSKPDTVLRGMTDAERQMLIKSLSDSIRATIKPVSIDTHYVKIKIKNPYIPDGYVHQDSIDTTFPDSVIVEKMDVMSRFVFDKPKEFSVTALTHAECSVESIDFIYRLKADYWTEYADRHFKKGFGKGYIQGRKDYPTWKKIAYFSAGILTVSGIAWAVK